MASSVILSEGNATLAARLPTHVLSVGSILKFDGVIEWSHTTPVAYINRLIFVGEIWDGLPYSVNAHQLTSTQTMKEIAVTAASSGSKPFSFTYALSKFGSFADNDLYLRVYVYEVGTNGLQYPFAYDITVVFDNDYANPAISAFSVTRCNTSGVTDEVTGTKAKVSITYAIDALANTNEKHLVIKSRETGTTPWTEQTVVITGYAYANTISDLVLDRVFEIEKSYEFQAVVTDLRNPATASGVMTTAKAWLMWNAEKTGACFGGYCEGPGLDVAKMGLRNQPNWLSLLGIQFGSFSTPTAAGGQDAPAQTFAKAYAAAPKIFFQLNYAGAGFTDLRIVPGTLSATGFTPKVYNTGSTNRGTVEVFWFAIGTLA